MTRRLLLSSIVLVTMSFAADANGWGLVVSGVRMRIEVSGDPNPDLRVSVQNVSDKPILLTLGSLIGARFHDLRFRVVLKLPDGKDRQVIYTGSPVGVAGRVDPLVVPLLPNARYTIQAPLASFYVLDKSAKLDTMISQRGHMRVELTVQNTVCPEYGYPNPNMIPCWQGTLVSNDLSLPN